MIEQGAARLDSLCRAHLDTGQQNRFFRGVQNLGRVVDRGGQ